MVRTRLMDVNAHLLPSSSQSPEVVAMEKQVRNLTANLEQLTRQNQVLNQKLLKTEKEKEKDKGKNKEGGDAESRQEQEAETRAKHTRMTIEESTAKTDSPFTQAVISFPLPSKFRMPSLETFDGAKDPLDHLESFKTMMCFQGVPDEIMCCTFPTTLKGSARIWFKKLTPGSVGSFAQLSHHIFMQIKDDPILKWPGKLMTNPDRKAKDRYYHFHRDHGHNMEDCYDLRRQIEELIKRTGRDLFDRRRREEDNQNRTTMPKSIQDSVVQFLRENVDVFAWSHEDMPGISTNVMVHKLNINPSIHPVKQKRRVFVPERNATVMEEVDKLLTAGFIKEVYYPEWLANVVMVKKPNEKWRMCVDFTDLNKACPKDSYPFPRIDQLVDFTVGHKVFSFMDAFSGYNQIQMEEKDQEKTDFITSRRLFCYKAMSFGLKNAGATYQRLVNKMFHDQIGRNVKVYVDDMLIKSKENEDHLADLKETFQALRGYNMKLNPEKIEANPDKIKAILEMRPPTTIKEVQSLTGKATARNRFVSKSIDKCLPFFKILRKAFC
uniref:Reverse transcriptase domain-containing protein n=1 Tax=Fagus sylvatica TaxID=28930 RepID=A0A2N9H299_FAGSY